jgi:nitrile hydratase
MDGFSLPDRDPDAPAFKHDWERLVFGSHLAMKKPWGIDESRFGVESLPPDVYLAAPYYARWLMRNENLLIKYGLVTQAELESPADVPQMPATTDSEAKDASGLLASMVSEPDSEAMAARFKPGDRVRVRNEHPAGHTRAPRYARGHAGTVQRDQGVHVFPDTMAHGLGSRDLFDDYLDYADR